jgi:two-component system response regulator RegA
MTTKPLLLIVEDDTPLRDRLRRAFEDRGFEVVEAATTEAADKHLQEEIPEFVLLDLRVPSAGGLAMVSRFKQADASTRIVVLTGYGSIATAVEAVKRGATQYLTKPADADQILAAFGASVATTPETDSVEPMSLDRVEWEHVNRVLAETGGNISEAARVLGIHRRSLQRKLNRYPSKR